MFEDYGIADEFSYDIKTQRTISQWFIKVFRL
jgi:hypothetical protein